MANPVRVVNPETGEVFTTEGGEAAREALLRGYDLAEDQGGGYGVTVDVFGANMPRVVGAKEAKEMILSGRGELGSTEERLRREEEARFDSPVQGFLAGLPTGASAGLYDAGLRALSPEDADYKRRMMEANPRAALAGEVLGFVGGTIATGGASALGRLVARGGTGLASRAAAGAAVGVAEGAVMGAGKELSTQALQGRELDSSKIASAFGHGALVGGLVGGALPVAGAGLRMVGDVVTDVSSNIASRASRALTDAAGSTAAGKDASSFLLRYARDKGFTATGASPKQLERILGSTPEVQAAADSILVRELPAVLGKTEGAILPRAEALSGVSTIKQIAKQEVADALAQVDARAAQGSGPRIGEIVKRAEAEVLAPLEQKFFGSSGTKQIRDKISDIASLKDYRVGYSGLQELSNELGVIAQKASGAESKSLLKLQRVLDEEIMKGATAASESAGVDLGTQLAASSQRAEAARLLEKALETGVKAEKAALRGGGFIEELQSIKGTTLAGASIGSTFGPVGSVLGGAAGMLAGSTLKKMKVLYGDQVVANAARALAEGQPAKMASMIDGLVGNAAAQYIRKGTEAAAAVMTKVAPVAAKTAEVAPIALVEAGLRKSMFGESSVAPSTNNPGVVSREQRLKNAVSRVERGGAAPAQVKAVTEAIQSRGMQQEEQLMAALEDAPPDVAAVIQGQLNASSRATQYLLSLVPQSSNTVNTLTPQAEGPRMTKTDVDTLVTAARVVADPLSVLQSMEAGTITKVEVDALRATSPEFYEQLVGSIQGQLSALEEPLPYKETVQLSILLGIPGDPSMDPAAMSWLQAGYTQAAPPQQQPPAMSSQPAPTRGKITSAQDWALFKEET
jgi:hypothetical protein